MSIAVVMMLSLFVGMAASAAHGQGNGQPAAERFVLSGVIVFEGGGGLAWLQEPTLTGNSVVTVRPGDSVGPYRLTRILEDRIELEGPAGKVLVPIYGVHDAPGTAVASAVPSSLPQAGGAGVALDDPPVLAPELPRSPRLDPMVVALGERLGAAKRQAEERKALEALEPEPPVLVNPFANNPSVLFYPQDPRAKRGFQDLLGGR